MSSRKSMFTIEAFEDIFHVYIDDEDFLGVNNEDVRTLLNDWLVLLKYDASEISSKIEKKLVRPESIHVQTKKSEGFRTKNLT